MRGIATTEEKAIFSPMALARPTASSSLASLSRAATILFALIRPPLTALLRFLPGGSSGCMTQAIVSVLLIRELALLVEMGGVPNHHPAHLPLRRIRKAEPVGRA